MTSITFDEYREACAAGFAPDFPEPLLYEGEAATLLGGSWWLKSQGPAFEFGGHKWRTQISLLEAFISASSGPERPVEGGRLLFFPGPYRAD